jgi:type I restriction enzyme M protein
MSFQDKVSFIWSIAELLRGDYKQSDYGKVILPLVVIRRLDCVLEPTNDQVMAQYKNMTEPLSIIQRRTLERIAGAAFYNVSPFTLAKLKDFPAMIADNLKSYIQGFSENARDIIQHFEFDVQISKLNDAGLVFLIIERILEIDLHPNVVSNMEMGYIFEELIRRFSEQSNETAGEHFTPREVIRLMVNVLFAADDQALTAERITRRIYDPACGTGGMLAVAQQYLSKLNPTMNIQVFGQELNPESYAVCKSDMLVKGLDANNIKLGNSFTQDQLENEQFHYFLSNPPFGVDWKKVEADIRKEFTTKGYEGRFGAGLPRVSDGSLLFLQHMISKMKPGEGRIAIVLNGSPLFTGGAGSGESEIRRWIIENDWLEAIIGLPDLLFYNTGISTYIWVVTNHKPVERQGKVQLIDATNLFQKMRKSLGNKRNALSEEHIKQIVEWYSYFGENENSKIFDNEDFGYRRITIERPLRLNFQASPERITRLNEQKVFEKLGAENKQEIRDAISTMDQEKLYTNRNAFTRDLKKTLDQASVSVKPALMKVLLATLSEKDHNADICTNSKCNPEPDTDLRDYENVPLKESIYEYFEREVKPYVPDAWINEDIKDEKDEQVGKVGYEIPFTRYFYQFEALRPSEKIAIEIRSLEDSILDKIRGLFV